MSNSRDNKLTIILGVICIISNISQAPIFLRLSFTKIIIFMSWLFLLGYILYKFKLGIDKHIQGILFLTLCFDLFITSAYIFTTRNYLSSNFIYPVHLCVFILVVSYFVGLITDNEVMSKISNYYIWSALIVGVNIYFEVFRGVDFENTTGYLYGAKNSIGPIFLVAIILLLVYYKNSISIIKYLILSFFIILLILLKSRTTIIGLIIATIYYVLFIVKSNKVKIVILSGIIIFLFYIFNDEYLYDFFVNKIMLNGKLDQGMDAISSGRLSHIDIFLEKFNGAYLIGYGKMYLESFPLAILISYGIIGSIPLFILSIKPLIISFKYRKNKKNNMLMKVVVLLTIVMLINGLFEELAPFGPGVKVYMLWLVFGLFLGRLAKERGVKWRWK